MKRLQRVIVGLVVVSILGFIAWKAFAPRAEDADVLTGSIEAETLFLSSPVAGPVARVDVVRGQTVSAGQALFSMDPSLLAAERDRSRAGTQAAAAQARDARKGERPAELAISESQAAAARARERESRLSLERAQVLNAKGYLAQAGLDQARAAHDAAAADVRALEARRTAGTLGARADAIAAADANVSGAEAGLTQSQRRLEQLTPTAPAAGRIEDVFFQAGEWAAPNQPILALIPDGKVRLRFYVPEKQIQRYRPGTRVSFGCDGCPGGLTAVIDFVSPRPEFTPPVIYSRKSRERMSFRVEARPEQAASLTPGLPADVEPLK